MKKMRKLDVIVHEWLSLPYNERLTEIQAVSFAKKAKKRHNFPDDQLILRQISKHVGKSY